MKYLINFVLAYILCEIQWYQKSAELLILKLPFQHVIKEIITEVTQKSNFWIQAIALLILQETTEVFLVSKFENKLYCFTLIVRLIVNIFSGKFVYYIWPASYITGSGYAAGASIARPHKRPYL